jgi:hypothetical protein
MTRNNKKRLFNLIGIVIVAFWVVMIGLLFRKVTWKDRPRVTDRGDGMIAIVDAQREWKEIFFKDRKVGYAVNTVKPFNGGYFIREEIFLRLNLMGMGSGMYTVTQARVDEGFFLKSFDFAVTSGVVRFSISGRLEGDRLLIETGKGKNKRSQSIPVSDPPMMGAGMGYFFKSRKIQVGETYRFPLFDPSTMSQSEVFIRVAGRGPLTINRMTYDAFRLETEMWGKRITFWIDENGTTLKEEGFMGLTTVKSSAARAPEDLEGERGVDLYEVTAVKTDRKLPDPDRLNSLKLRFVGLDRAGLSREVLHGGRQSYRQGIMEVTRETLPQRPSYSLPHEEFGEEMRSFLEPEFNIESDAPEIRKKAGEISGGEGNPLFIARKLTGWVYQHLEKRPVLSLPSALEVLRTRVGDCNEHATLLTALLRASGIPARISIGLVYTREKFFYHAWTEAYLGEWISMDATLNQIPVDATHIKLVEGNLDKQVAVAGLIGEIEVEVLDYRYD